MEVYLVLYIVIFGVTCWWRILLHVFLYLQLVVKGLESVYPGTTNVKHFIFFKSTSLGNPSHHFKNSEISVYIDSS